MPNRIIKESICTSDSISMLSWFEECLFIRLIVTVDDFGRMDARPKILKGRAFPLANVTEKQIDDGLRKLASIGIVDLYTVGGKPYLCLPTWNDHQTPRAKESKYPGPEESDGICKQMQADACTCKQMQADACTCKQMQADAPDIRYSNSIFDIRDTDAKKDRAPRFSPPSVEDVRAYCVERGNSVDAEQFVDFYTSKGWKIGSQSMKDWKAAVRTWEKRDDAAIGKKTAKSDTFKLNEADIANNVLAMRRILGE